MPTFQEYKDAMLDPTRHQIFKIEWMDKDENIIDEVITDLLDGSVSIQMQNGVRRSCNINFENNDGRFTPSNNGLVWISKKFKLYSGLVIDGEDVFPPESVQGVFNLGNPIVRSTGSTSIVSIEGYDNFSLLNGTLAGQLDTSVSTIEKGTLITDAVSLTLADAGIVQTPLIYSSDEQVPTNLVQEAGSTYGDVLIELANILAWQIYFNQHGRPVFKPTPDETLIDRIWDFNDEEVSYMGCDHNFNYADVRNNIVVYGDNIDGALAVGTAEDNGVFSPTSISRIGKRTKSITDNMIKDSTLAQNRANYELRNSIQAYEYVDLRCINLDFLEANDVVSLRDTNGALDDDRYLIKQINRNLNFNSTMTVKAWKVREI